VRSGVTISPFFYEVVPGRLLAGRYPSDLDLGTAQAKLNSLLDRGVTSFVDLMEEGETNYDGIKFASYDQLLSQLTAERGLKARYTRIPIRDVDIPPVVTMRKILDTISGANAGGSGVYVHCRGGIGRTGTVVGCYLVEQGLKPEEALAKIPELRRGLPVLSSPETGAQRRFVLQWRKRGTG